MLKNETIEIIDSYNTVKIWIQLNIPRIQDGNNFGVSIQASVVSDLHKAENSGLLFYENISKYFEGRAKITTKTEKHPNNQDYQQALNHLDEKKWINTWIYFVDLRSSYAIIYDLISKNIEKILQPRNLHPSTFY